MQHACTGQNHMRVITVYVQRFVPLHLMVQNLHASLCVSDEQFPDFDMFI